MSSTDEHRPYMQPESSHESLLPVTRFHEPGLVSSSDREVGPTVTARSATPTQFTIWSLYRRRQHRSSSRGSRVSVSSVSLTIHEHRLASPQQGPEETPAATLLDDGARPSESTTPAMDINSNGLATDFQRQKIKAAIIFPEVIGILATFCFLAFNIAIILIQDTSTDTAGRYKDAITVLAAILPIVFCMVVGQLMTHIVCWRLESGTWLQSLEQLLASRTVGGAALSVLTLPFGWLYIVLLFLCSFPPPGRAFYATMLRTKLQEFETNTTLIYFDTNTNPMLDFGLVSTLQSDPVGGPSIIASIYMA
ncbi:uncharacterized protein PgNI_08677 [Pyricularia grisea]|uniref:Uncharacterized protein n=1 Tax=Pyricularia grisea TaxID=148305 RepID=A0A6P8AWX0_PYRGI|nr:uncharacterized protein PgNI_08677 [Pyricularia grisea]TLD06726.1 hypothetical protein PgNI_08677 [Pyricularia grisea]